MVFSFPAFFISEVYFFRILKFLPISTYTLYNIVLARVHKISIFQSYLLIVFQHLLNYHSYWWHVCVYSFAQSCPTLFDPMDCSPPGYSVHGILQARILRWVAMPFSRGSSQPKYQTRSPALQANFFTAEPLGKPIGGMTCLQICIHGVPCRRETQAWWRLTWGREQSEAVARSGVPLPALRLSCSCTQSLTDSRSQGSCAVDEFIQHQDRLRDPPQSVQTGSEQAGARLVAVDDSEACVYASFQRVLLCLSIFCRGQGGARAGVGWYWGSLICWERGKG